MCVCMRACVYVCMHAYQADTHIHTNARPHPNPAPQPHTKQTNLTDTAHKKTVNLPFRYNKRQASWNLHTLTHITACVHICILPHIHIYINIHSHALPDRHRTQKAIQLHMYTHYLTNTAHRKPLNVPLKVLTRQASLQLTHVTTYNQICTYCHIYTYIQIYIYTHYLTDTAHRKPLNLPFKV